MFNAVLKIQKTYRGKKERHNIEKLKNTIKTFNLACSIPKLNQSIIKIQSFARMLKAKKNFAQLKVEKNPKTKNFHAFYNSKTETQDNDFFHAALKIQKSYKGKKERQKLENLKETIKKLDLKCDVARLNKAVLIIQSFARRFKAKYRAKAINKQKNLNSLMNNGNKSQTNEAKILKIQKIVKG